jgi:predicted P-loop ATPase
MPRTQQQPGADPASPTQLPAAIAELIDLGERFVLWKTVPDRETGRTRKVPIQARTGKAASSTDPATWATWDACRNAQRRHHAAGIGVVFNGDGLGGIDLDTCRDPATGAIAPWAQEIIADLNSYAEVSPSGTGVKVLFRADPVPRLRAHKRTVGEAGGDHPPAVELYVTGRYFTITCRHLEGTPDEITDATEAVERLARWIAEERGDGPAPDHNLPTELVAAIDADPELREAWASGRKLGSGGDSSRSGKDFSLVLYLARSGWTNELIELALRHYPHGQIGSDALKGRNAERRLEKLLRKADETRAKAPRWQGTDQPWHRDLLLTRNGEARDCIANGAIILRQDPAFAGKIRYDEHQQCPMCQDLPWRQRSDWHEWGDIDDARFAEWCQLRGVPLRVKTAADAVAVVADGHRHHPVREYLDGLRWDGTARLDRWLITYFGADEGKAHYLAKVGAKWLISAVARIYQPGCDAQHLLVLEGRQGARKSRSLAALVPDRRQFTDDIAEAGTKDGAQNLAGVWIVELSELSAIRRGAVERVKAYLSRSTDHYRPTYGRRSGHFPRQCVFVGTTNEHAYLHDPSGNRRFWPVAVTRGDVDGVRRDRDQLWAEAVERYRAGETWHLDEEDERLAAEEQAEREEHDVWTERVLEWAERRVAPFTASAALSEAIGMPVERQGRAEETRVGTILRRAGYVTHRCRLGGGRIRLYSRPEEEVGPGVGPEVGPEKTSNHAGGPTGPTGPTDFYAHESRDHYHHSGVDEPGSRVVVVSLGEMSERGLARLDHPVPWHHDASWSLRFLQARTYEERLAILGQWVMAAGGRLVSDGMVELPELPPGLARAELFRQCANLRVRVTRAGILPAAE